MCGGTSPSTVCNSASPGSSSVCNVYSAGPSGPVYFTYANIALHTASAPIYCTEVADHRYATPYRDLNGVPLGDSTHDSVIPMNAKVGTVDGWATANRGMYQTAKERGFFASDRAD